MNFKVLYVYNRGNSFIETLLKWTLICKKKYIQIMKYVIETLGKRFVVYLPANKESQRSCQFFLNKYFKTDLREQTGNSKKINGDL